VLIAGKLWLKIDRSRSSSVAGILAAASSISTRGVSLLGDMRRPAALGHVGGTS
jgi:hypothetical protein